MNASAKRTILRLTGLLTLAWVSLAGPGAAPARAEEQATRVADIYSRGFEYLNKPVVLHGSVIRHLEPRNAQALPDYELNCRYSNTQIKVIPHPDAKSIPNMHDVVAVQGIVSFEQDPQAQDRAIPVLIEGRASPLRGMPLGIDPWMIVMICALVLMLAALTILCIYVIRKVTQRVVIPPPVVTHSPTPVPELAGVAAGNGSADHSLYSPGGGGFQADNHNGSDWLTPPPTPEYQGYFTVEKGKILRGKIAINAYIVRIGKFTRSARERYDIMLEDEYVSDVHAQLTANKNNDGHIIISNLSEKTLNVKKERQEFKLPRGAEVELEDGDRVGFNNNMVVLRYSKDSYRG